jgi:hypothetical protein
MIPEWYQRGPWRGRPSLSLYSRGVTFVHAAAEEATAGGRVEAGWETRNPEPAATNSWLPSMSVGEQTWQSARSISRQQQFRPAAVLSSASRTSAGTSESGGPDRRGCGELRA